MKSIPLISSTKVERCVYFMTSRKTYKRSINLARISDPITEGNGWINVTVDDGVLPYMPGLDRSLSEQKARLSVFHQLHCLYIARDAFVHARDGHLERVHVDHLSDCWDYLRQGIMCAGDATLEWKHANASDGEGWGYQHMCKDYALLFMFAEQYRATEEHSLRGEY
ncbi:Oxidase ustYa [Colletotrichum siamense]|nr:Oxidase ustYa [Colletotrichum siamense]